MGDCIRHIANTSFHADYISGNQTLKNSGSDPSVVGTFLALNSPGVGATATIIAHENVAARMTGTLGTNPPTAPDSWPIDTYLTERRRQFHNGDSIEMFYMPHASTDGDSIVHFRRADIIVAGDTLIPRSIRLSTSPTEAVFRARSMHLTPSWTARCLRSGEGGTLVVPGRGYLCDEHEVVEYRDMVAIVRDRVKALIASGASLEQVLAAKVTTYYDKRYGANSGPWTTQMFVSAVYQSLKQPPKK